MFRIDSLIFFDENLAASIGNVKARDFTFPTVTDKLHHAAFTLQLEMIELKELRQNGFGRQADCLEQNRDRHLAASVDTEKQYVFRVKFEIKP